MITFTILILAISTIRLTTLILISVIICSIGISLSWDCTKVALLQARFSRKGTARELGGLPGHEKIAGVAGSASLKLDMYDPKLQVQFPWSWINLYAPACMLSLSKRRALALNTFFQMTDTSLCTPKHI